MHLKFYLLTLIFCSVLFTNCKKWYPENRIEGTWKLVEVQKRKLLSNDIYLTGYESGSFVFNANGNASYTDAAGVLTGTWSMHRSDDGYYGSDGNWHGDRKTIFIVHVNNFAANRVIDWYFDNIDFRGSGDKLFAYIDRGSYTYRYDFRRQ